MFLTPTSRVVALVLGAIVLGAMSPTIPVLAEDLPEIRWRFEEGMSRRYTTERTYEMLIQASSPLRVSQLFALDLDLHVDSVAGDGGARLRAVVERVHWRGVAGPDARFDWDSTGKRVGELPEEIRTIFDALASAEFGLRVEPDGEVIELELPEALAKAVEKQPASMQNLDGLLSRSGLVRLFDELLVGFPAPEKSDEARWTRRETLHLTADHEATREIAYRYTGPLKSLRTRYETFELSSRWLLTEKAAGAKTAVEDERSKGTLRFDATHGALHSLDLETSFTLKSPRRAVVDGVVQSFDVKTEWRQRIAWKQR